jgi:hypothetical protein
VKRGLAGVVIALLLAVGGYSAYVAIVAILDRGGQQYDPSIFWPSIGVFWLVAAAALWGALRLYRRRFAKVS